MLYFFGKIGIILICVIEFGNIKLRKNHSNLKRYIVNVIVIFFKIFKSQFLRVKSHMKKLYCILSIFYNLLISSIMNHPIYFLNLSSFYV